MSTTKDVLKIFRAVLATAYKMQDGDIDEVLNSSDVTEEDAIKLFLQKDKDRVAELSKPREGQTRQDGYKQAQKEILSNFENELLTKFGFDNKDELKGLDLVEALINSAKGTAGKGKEITDDDVKKHPLYQSLQKASKDELKKVTDEWSGKLTELETSINRKNTLSKVQEIAWNKVTAMNPVLPKNPAIAETLKKTFLNLFSDLDYDIEGDKITGMKKDGKLLEDGHGHPEDFEKFLKTSVSNYFEFSANNGGSNAGNGQQDKDKQQNGGAGPAKGEYPTGITRPKTLEEVNTIMRGNNSLTQEQKNTVWETFKAEQTPA